MQGCPLTSLVINSCLVSCQNPNFIKPDWVSGSVGTCNDQALCLVDVSCNGHALGWLFLSQLGQTTSSSLKAPLLIDRTLPQRTWMNPLHPGHNFLSSCVGALQFEAKTHGPLENSIVCGNCCCFARMAVRGGGRLDAKLSSLRTGLRTWVALAFYGSNRSNRLPPVKNMRNCLSC